MSQEFKFQKKTLIVFKIHHFFMAHSVDFFKSFLKLGVLHKTQFKKGPFLPTFVSGICLFRFSMSLEQMKLLAAKIFDSILIVPVDMIEAS